MKDEHDSAVNVRRAREGKAKPGAATRSFPEARVTEASGESFPVVGGSRSGKVRPVNAGELPVQETLGEPVSPAAVRAAVVALKSGNADGAKGGRKANPSSEGERETNSPRVPPPADKQGEEDLWQRYGAERGIWSEKMLVALDKGVKGNRWFSLIDKIARPDTLGIAWAKVQSNAGACGVDGITVERFAKDSQSRLLAVREHIMRGTYQPKPVRRVWIPKAGSPQKRPLGIPTVTDRVVQSALRMVVEPIFEREFASHSYGFRPGRSCHDALRRVDVLLQSGYTHVVDIDIKGYFDAIPHEHLMAKLGERIADGRVLELIQGFLKAGVMEGMERWEADTGAPQGAVMSPLLANVYLNPLDWLLTTAGLEAVRYADDLIVLCRDAQSAQHAMGMIEGWMKEAGLELNQEKSRIVELTMSGSHFDFLGYRFWRGKSGKIRRFVRPKSEKSLRERLKPLTRRASGWSMTMILQKLNPILRGWYGYFKQVSANSLRQVDQWVRSRLRAILRKRRKGKGRASTRDQQRWNNCYFKRLGLFCLEDARAAELTSLRRGATC